MLVSPAMGPALGRSSMEVMLDSIRQRDEKPKDSMPTLPGRPVSKGRLPSSRLLAVKSKLGDNFALEQEMVMGAERKEEKDVMKIGSFACKETRKMEQPEESPCDEMPRLVSYEEAEFKDLAESGSSSSSDARSGETIDYVIRKGTNKEHAHLRPTVLEELERRVLKSETALRQKEEENLTLKQQLGPKEEENLTLKQQLRQKEEENLTMKQQLLQYESRWSDYEVKMKSMEEMWQKQLTSLQMSLAAAKKSLAADDMASRPGKSENTPGEFQTPESTPAKQPHGSDAILPKSSEGTGNPISHMAKEFEQKRQVFEDDARLLAEAKSGQLVHGVTSDEELQKLKTSFAAWKKDYKVKLRETKVKLQKNGKSELVKTHKWWIMRIKKRFF